MHFYSFKLTLSMCV